MSNERQVVLQGQVLPAEHRAEVRVPARPPLGMPVLGRMKYRAVARLLEAYEEAIRAKTRVHDAETENAYALVRREVAREQLRSIDLITGEERNRLQGLYNDRVRREEEASELAELARMQRQLLRLELEDQIQDVRDRRGGSRRAPSPPTVPHQFAEALRLLGDIPDLAVKAAEVKQAIIARAGGEDRLSEADLDLMAQIDAVVSSAVSKTSEGSVL